MEETSAAPLQPPRRPPALLPPSAARLGGFAALALLGALQWQRMIDGLETGMMGLNVGVVSNAAAPFGGVKQSGVGREGGFEGIHEYLSTKYTLIPVS